MPGIAEHYVLQLRNGMMGLFSLSLRCLKYSLLDPDALED